MRQANSISITMIRLVAQAAAGAAEERKADPIYAAIEAREHATRELCAEREPPVGGTPAYVAWQRRNMMLAGTHHRTSQKLLTTIPTTAKGLTTLLAYLRNALADGDFCLDDETDQGSLLFAIEAAVRRLHGLPPPE